MMISGVGCVKGFGLLDLMLTLIIASLLAALAVPVYGEFASRVKMSQASEDITSLGRRIESFCDANQGRCPASLDELPGKIPLDPWGSHYRYVNLSIAYAATEPFRIGDDQLPLNTDFDLYSIGADRASTRRMSAAASRDDILRANNGVFVGLAADY